MTGLKLRLPEIREPSSREPLGENIRQLPIASIWLFETSSKFGDIPDGYFRTRLPGGSAVICKCRDECRTVLLDPSNGKIAAVY
jgi:hypothetical protein